MKKYFLPGLILVGFLVSSCAPTTTPTHDTDNEIKVEFNERQVDKHLSQYSEQLDLSRRQQRRIVKIEKNTIKRRSNSVCCKSVKNEACKRRKPRPY